MKLKRWLTGFLALTMLAGVGASASAEEKTTVTVYTARDMNVIEYVEPLFEEAYPQYDLEVLNMGAQEILERVRGEQANPQADFLWGGTEAAFKMAAQEGLLEAYVPSFAESFPDQYKDPDDLWYGEILLPEVIMYNSDALAPEDVPTSWNDLLDAKFEEIGRAHV